MAEHMLIVGVEDPQGREDLSGGGLSQCLRENQFCDDDSAEAVAGWKVHYGWR